MAAAHLQYDALKKLVEGMEAEEAKKEHVRLFIAAEDSMRGEHKEANDGIIEEFEGAKGSPDVNTDERVALEFEKQELLKVNGERQEEELKELREEYDRIEENGLKGGCADGLAKKMSLDVDGMNPEAGRDRLPKETYVERAQAAESMAASLSISMKDRSLLFHHPLTVKALDSMRGQLNKVTRALDGWFRYRLRDECLASCREGARDAFKLAHEMRKRFESQVDIESRTALMRAAILGQMEVVTALFEAGASPYRLDYFGRSALHHGACGKRAFMLPVVQFLLQEGVPCEVGDLNGITPLMSACQGGQKGIVEALVQHGAKLERGDGEGLTAIMHAAKWGHGEVVTRLIELGSSLTNYDDSGNAVLHIAATAGHEAAVKPLVDAKADTRAENFKGETPVVLALINGKKQLSALMQDAGASDEDHPDCRMQ